MGMVHFYSWYHALCLIIAAFSPIAVVGTHADGQRLFPLKCFPDACKGVTFSNATYVCGNSLLGPLVFPKKFPLATELRTYARFGDLCPAEFLAKWTTNSSSGLSYVYPPSNGFVVEEGSNGPILGNASLPVGMKLDRFGSEYGSFLAPLGAPYIERSLPPSNLDTYDGNYPNNYHVYQVTKPFTVQLGPIASWFEQPGMGAQFLAASNIMTLISGGYLRRLTESEYDDRVEYSDNYTPGPGKSSA